MDGVMNREERREAERHLRKTNAQFPANLVEVPREQWPVMARDSTLHNVWRSRDYLVQVFREPSPCVARLSVVRTAITASGGWQEDIPWTELQRLKGECGFGPLDAVEVFPRDIDVVNVANIRHLFVLAAPLSFAWRKA